MTSPEKKTSRRSVLKVLGATAVAAKFTAGGDSAGATTNRTTGQCPPSDVHSTAGRVPRNPDAPLKIRAQRDYAHSLRAVGGRLSNPIDQLLGGPGGACQDIVVDVAIVGSGYGASICALRLAQRLVPGRRLCILERGREWIPGTFPDTFRDISRESRSTLVGARRGDISNPLGLYNVSLNKDINLLSGSALGGTSLINANVALKADSDVFRQSAWPQALSDRAVIDPYYELAAQNLNLTRSPLGNSSKMRSQQVAAAKLSRRPGFFDRSPLAVTYDHRYLDDQMQNQFGMIQRLCIQCGDCITGCNIGAKNHLLMNYLPMAKAHGAEMYTQIEVTNISPGPYGYEIRALHRDDSSGQLVTTPVRIHAELVVVACGSPGSAHVLMQSQTDQFRFSPALGTRWTFNGDTIGFAMETDVPANIAGVGANCTDSMGPGPTIETSLIYERRPELKNRIVIQEAALPNAVKHLFKFLMRDRDLTNSMVMLGMGHDEGEGKIVWRDGRWQIDWPRIRKSEYRQKMFTEFGYVARTHGGWYKRLKEFGDNMVTVHPLGACGMSDDPAAGVVNHLGQVYDWSYHCHGRRNFASSANSLESPGVHRGLYVADGSIFPTPIGVNPFMTIAALSERIAHQMTADPTHGHLFRGRASQ